MSSYVSVPSGFSQVSVGEKLQENGNVHISYEVLETVGPDHDKTFVVEVSCDGRKLATRKR